MQSRNQANDFGIPHMEREDRQTRRGRLAKLKILFELIGSPWLYPFEAAMCLHERNETETEMTTVSCLTS